jgi:hypothetical protein
MRLLVLLALLLCIATVGTLNYQVNLLNSYVIENRKLISEQAQILREISTIVTDQVSLIGRASSALIKEMEGGDYQ